MERTDKTEIMVRAAGLYFMESMTQQEIAELVLFLVTWKGNGVIDEINIRRPDASYWAAL